MTDVDAHARVIRTASTEDLRLLAAIEDAADESLIAWLNPVSWQSAPSGESRSASPGFVLVVSAKDTDPIVGFVHVLEVGGLAHLEQVSVRPDVGRRGHGRALVRAAMLEASRRGCATMSLRTFADVPRNAPFYRSLGFVEVEPRSSFELALVRAEEQLGLALLGPRIQMQALLPRPDLPGTVGP